MVDRNAGEIQNANTYKQQVGWVLNSLGSSGKYVLDGFGSFCKIAAEFVATIFTALAREQNFMPFIAFIIIVGVIITIGVSALSSKPKRGSVGSNNFTAPPSMNFFNPLSFVEKIIPSYKIRSLTSVFMPYSTVPPSSITDRPKIKGRCDNLQNYTAPGETACSHTSTPEPITWIIDINSMPEMNEISAMTKDHVDGGADAQKYIVRIPWVTYPGDGVYYYPDCSKATYGNGDRADLFIDNGHRSCEKKVVPRTRYGTRQRQEYTSSSTVAPDSFVSKNNPS